MKRRNDTNVNQYYRAVHCAIIGLRNRIGRTELLRLLSFYEKGSKKRNALFLRPLYMIYIGARRWRALNPRRATQAG